MSAIWGAIALDNSQISEGCVQVFQDAYKECVIDRREYLLDKNVLMGCEIQYFTPEAKKEQLPQKSAEGQCFFTADVYLDNRDQLLQDKLFAGENHGELADGEILFRFYQTYGRERLVEVIGSYSFVYYDRENNIINFVMDHMANRCLYYCLLDNVFYFSTIIKPLHILLKDKLHKNTKVLADFVALQDYRVYLDYEATIFEEIKHGVAGHIMQVSKSGIQKKAYWNPLKDVKILKGKTDEEYKKLLLDTFSEAVRNSVRTTDKIGISLSGGLDSTAVACFASPIAKERNEQLYAYTMVPKTGYEDDTEGYTTVNEQYLVECTAKHLGNVVGHYDSYDEMNAWDIRKEQIALLEGPYKSLQNVMWVKHLAGLAYKDGCRVLLNGQLGNDTISYGDQDSYLYELFITGKWKKLWDELNSHSQYYRYRKKKVLKGIWERFKGVESGEQMDKKKFYERSLVKTNVLDKYATYERSIELDRSAKAIKTRKQYKNLIVDPMRFRQIGDNETRISLHSGVLCKDPTRSVKVFELCMSFPTEQFNKGCLPRRLIYEYMKDYFPKELLDERLAKGQQSADFYYRLRDKWEEIYSELRQTFSKEHSILNNKKILQVLQNQTNGLENEEISLELRKQLEWLMYAKQVYDIEHRFF